MINYKIDKDENIWLYVDCLQELRALIEGLALFDEQDDSYYDQFKEIGNELVKRLVDAYDEICDFE